MKHALDRTTFEQHISLHREAQLLVQSPRLNRHSDHDGPEKTRKAPTFASRKENRRFEAEEPPDIGGESRFRVKRNSDQPSVDIQPAIARCPAVVKRDFVTLGESRASQAFNEVSVILMTRETDHSSFDGLLSHKLIRRLPVFPLKP